MTGKNTDYYMIDKYLTEDQVKKFKALMESGDRKAAQAYLNSILPQLTNNSPHTPPAGTKKKTK